MTDFKTTNVEMQRNLLGVMLVLTIILIILIGSSLENTLALLDESVVREMELEELVIESADIMHEQDEVMREQGKVIKDQMTLLDEQQELLDYYKPTDN